MLTHSDDDGVTWSPPSNISGVVHPSWRWVATGPPGSIQLESKRIIVPSYHSVLSLDGELSEVHMMISDDEGESWYIGGTVSDWALQFPNENQAVSLGGNSVFINARTVLTDRIAAYSTDGGLTFGSHFSPRGLSQPLEGCEGSTIRHPDTGVLYYSGPAVPFRSPLRYNMSIFTSLDSGTTWTSQAVIHPGSSAYSSLAILGDGHSIGLLYEWANQTKLIFNPDYFSFVVIN
jgi:sialidase-1